MNPLTGEHVMKSFGARAILAACLLVAACGDGGGGSVASAPAPAASPTPTPTTSPGFTPTVTPTETLPGTTGNVAALNLTQHEEILDATRVSIGRDSAGNYLITLPVITGQTVGLSEGYLRKFEFLATNRTTTSSGAQQYANGRSGSIFPNEKSIMTVLPAGTAANPLKYVNFASLTATLADTLDFGDPAIPGASPFVFGERTAIGDLPLSGSANYLGTFATGIGTRGFSAPTPPDSDNTSGGGIAWVGQLSGDLHLSVRFLDKTINGSLSNITDSTSWFSYASTDQNHRLTDFSLAGSYGSNGTLTGTLTAAAGSPFTTGIWNGMFFGPQAAEVGGSLILRASVFGSPVEYDGWFGGKKN